ncbi:MAG: trypsin-like peptidase domain-containing protein [Paludibacteraceae bacterium]|nr:trypsin-like peptidase domain-containing protein [Paludibacteraceae bacterium]
MKKLITILCLLSSITGYAGQVVFKNQHQRWEVLDIISNTQYTAIFCDIFILSNKAGCFEAHEDDKSALFYLYGSWGRSEFISAEFSGQYKAYTFVRGGIPSKNYYTFGNKGKLAKGIFYFTRIPAGVSCINWYCDGGWALEASPADKYHCPKFCANNLHVPNNPNTIIQTSYSEDSLTRFWNTHRYTPLEGIYSFLSTSSSLYWGKYRHKLAIVKERDVYRIIYLGGANSAVWEEGELKGSCVPTNTKGIYKIVTWYLENKMPSTADFYLEYNNNYVTLHDAKTGVETLFMKLYPTKELMEEDIEQTNTSRTVAEPIPTGNGSGFFVGGNTIATNHHVVDGAKKIEVVIQSKQKVERYSAKVLCADKVNDLALLTIEDANFSAYTSLPYAIATRAIDVGSSIFTMGYPMEHVMGSEIKVTDGIISSKTGYQGNIATYQISAPIQPGNSGGPMFSKNGYLVGITSAGIQDADNVGYAIKSNYLLNLIEAAPITIADISIKMIANMSLPEQIKILTPYVVLIYVYE